MKLGNLALTLFWGVWSLCLHNWELVILAVVGQQLYKRAIRYKNSPMKRQNIPGPFLAAFTCWYRAYYANVRRNWHEKLIELHDQYGPIVWIAPDEVSVADPKLRGALYSFADDRKEESFFRKSKSFETGLFNNDFNFVFETDPAKARVGKYTLSHPYSEKGLAKLEHHFDEAVQDFVEGFKEHVASNEKVHCLNDWTHFFMFDLATLLMGGYSHGLCLAGKDTGGAIAALRVIFNVVGSLVPVPFALDITTKFIRKSILYGKLEHLYSWSICYTNGESHKKDRINELADRNPNNLMSKFRAGEAKMRKVFPKGNWTEAITNNVFFIYAGSMVASSTLPMVLKYIYTNPRVLAKVREELSGLDGDLKMEDMAHVNGTCRLPYFEATLLECLRLNPAFGLSLGRTVPAIGCQLNDFFIPPGYTVSMSGWPTNLNRDYFGEDAKEFKPERWIGTHPTEIAKDGTGLPRTMRNYLEAGWFTWGAGARVCIGRHFSMISFAKLTARFIRQFDLEIVNGGYLWYGLIQHTEEMMVKARVRDDFVEPPAVPEPVRVPIS